MERLTTNKDVYEMGMVELAHNSCYVKDGAAWYRDYDKDIDARSLARQLLKDFANGDDAFTCDEDFDEYMTVCLVDGFDSLEGLIAIFYRNLWAMAGLHARLKHYEDLQEKGRLIELPCAVEDTVYCIMTSINGRNSMIFSQYFDYSMIEHFGKSVFLTKTEAERALKRGGVNE